MSLTIHDLLNSFRHSGIENGNHILVHSSLSSLGWVENGADTVIDALLEAVGDNGTVIFPTLTGSSDNTPTNPPVFDAKTTPCWTGEIPETARKREDALRSLHPTHSVAAIGKLAQWFTTGHEFVRTPCGSGSPYDKLADIGGKILLIGVTQSANTSFHHAEEVANVPYVLLDDPVDVTITDMHDEKIELQNTCLHRWGVKRDYDILENSMIDFGVCRIGYVGKTEVRIMDAMFQRMYLVSKLLEEPLATLALSERENWL